MSKEITKTDPNLPAMQTPDAEKIDARDVLIPALYLMQSNSTFVKEEKAKNGAIIKSTGVVTVANKGESVGIVPLAFNKSFRVVDKKGNKWVRNEAFNPGIADVWDFKEDGKDLKRVTCINVYAFLLSDLETQAKAKLDAEKTGDMLDPSAVAMPVLISFRSKGFKAGKEVITHFALAQRVKSEPYMGKLELSAHEEANDDGKFFVFDVKPLRDGKKLSKEALADCAEWRTLMTAGKVRVDESGEELESSEPPTDRY